MKLPVGYVAGEGLKSHNYSGYGQRLMEQMGWAKGKGLGKEENGITEHIKVKKKDDTLGVGVTTKYDWTDKWWENAFNNVANKFNVPGEIRNTDGASSSSSSSSSSSDSDSDAKQKKVAGDKKKKKLTKKKGSKRASSSSSSSSDSDSGSSSSDSSDSDSDGPKTHRDGTLAAGASTDELAILERLQKDKWGRWGGRDGKMARVRAMEEKLAAEARAKLMSSTLAPTDSPSAKPTANPTPAAHGKSAGAAATAAKLGGNEVVGKDGRKRWIIEIDVPQTKRQRVEAPPTPTPKEGWWGCKLGFVSAGFMGGADRDMEHKRNEFTENDQERVYMAAHNAKTTGKGGLGIGKPVGESKLGKDFAGAKKTFGDDDEDIADPPTEAKASASGSDSDSDKKKSKKGKKEKKKEGKDGEAAAAAVPWRKVIRKLLESAGKDGMKLKKLEAACMKEGMERAGAKGATEDQLKKCFSEVLKESSKFSVEGKTVRLKA